MPEPPRAPDLALFDPAARSVALRKPPLSIAIVGTLFLALAALDLYRGLAPLVGAGHLAGDDLLVLAIGVAAGVGAVFVYLGHEWARWLLAAWMALHVGVSIGNPRQLVMHALIFGLIAFFLFRPPVREHFHPSA